MFQTISIAGNEFLSLRGGSYNLRKLDSAVVWVVWEDEDEDKFVRIVLSFEKESIYLSLEGDHSHKSGAVIYTHYELSADVFEKALQFFGLSSEDI